MHLEYDKIHPDFSQICDNDTSGRPHNSRVIVASDLPF
jgi:hypothetical protein